MLLLYFSYRLPIGPSLGPPYWARLEEADCKWRLSNRRLRSTAPGVEYRNSKKLEDRAEERETWGSVISGHDEGDGWVRCVNTSTAEFAQSLALALANYEDDT